MARLHIDLPASFRFSTEIQIYFSHINLGGHLDNAQLLTLVSEARLRFFKSLGYSEGNVEGHRIAVGDMMVQYRSEAFHGETMCIGLEPADFNKYGLDLVFCVTDKATSREVARGKTGIVFIHPHERKAAAIPVPFLAKLN